MTDSWALRLRPYLGYGADVLDEADKNLERQKQLQKQIFDLSNQKGGFIESNKEKLMKEFLPEKDNIQMLKEEYAEFTTMYKNKQITEAQYEMSHAVFAKKIAEANKLLVGSHQETARKMHDVVHELPYRLPWFMGT